MERLKRSIFSFWFLLVCIVFLSAFFASYYYWETFGSQRSSNSSDWSAFGSYFGGVFGPLISFCTLLAVLKTVYLQRELLDAQRLEFERMGELQRETLDGSADDAKKLQVSAARDTAVKVIDQHISIYERNFDRHHKNASEFTESLQKRAPLADDDEFFNSLILHRGVSRKVVDKLCQLSVTLAVYEFESVDDVRHALAAGLEEIRENISYELSKN